LIGENKREKDMLSRLIHKHILIIHRSNKGTNKTLKYIFRPSK